jgi:FkbM family methyltransferase
MKKIIDFIMQLLDLKLIRRNTYTRLVESENIRNNLDFSKEIYHLDPYRAYSLINFSKSQIRQDIAALAISEFKQKGFFVEFGATNGIELSNTYLLEKSYNWTGILAEPAAKWHNDLESTRNCYIEKKCVWSETGRKLKFVEVDYGELSTLKDFSDNDLHSKLRKKSTEYAVETISMNDLLEKYDAPEIIDYFSIDTEGSEYDILEKINYDKYKFNFITVEHNYTKSRDKIYKLLRSKGYKRVFEEYSYWDDWYQPER